MKQEGYNILLTLRAFSNHLTATVAAGKIMGFKTIGVVRGEEERKLNSSLQFCQDQGMILYPISRSDYVQHLPKLMMQLKNKFEYFIPA